MEEVFPYLWIERKDRKRCLKYSAKATGIRIKYDKGIDTLLVDQIDELVKYLSKHYYFPVRVNIHVTAHKRYKSSEDGHVYYGVFHDNVDAYEKRKLYPKIYVAGQLCRSVSIEQILYVILHELSHYFQWFFDELKDRSDRSVEIEATKWAKIIFEEYKEYQTIVTPFGKLNIYVDGELINYLAIKLRYNHPCCKDKPVFACYRINGSVAIKTEVKCVIESTQNLEIDAASGEEYISNTFIKDRVMLTLGTRDTAYDERPQYNVNHIENGLIFTDLAKKTEIIIGVAWVIDGDEWDIRTWYAADPTLDKFCM